MGQERETTELLVRLLSQVVLYDQETGCEETSPSRLLTNSLLRETSRRIDQMRKEEEDVDYVNNATLMLSLWKDMLKKELIRERMLCLEREMFERREVEKPDLVDPVKMREREGLGKLIVPIPKMEEIPEEIIPIPDWGSAFKCWNCGERGHFRPTCPAPKSDKKFCYGCGRLDKTLRTCGDCRPAWLAEGGPLAPTRKPK